MVLEGHGDWLLGLTSPAAAGSASTTTTSEVEAVVRHSILVDDPAYALMKRLVEISSSYASLIDHAALARVGAPPITASDVDVTITPRRGSSTLSATIRTRSDVAAEVAKHSLEAALPDMSKARLHLSVSAREAPHCTIAISRVHTVERPGDGSAFHVLPSLQSVQAYDEVASSNDTSSNGFDSAGEYITAHGGFVLALGLLITIPLLALIGCCIYRRCRKQAAETETGRKKQTDSSAPSLADPEDFDIAPPPPAPTVPMPVTLNPALLPVDAFHGVPPSRNL